MLEVEISERPPTLAQGLRELRHARGLGVRELARRAGTTKRSIQDWETERHAPKGPALDCVLDALEAPIGLRARLLALASPAFAQIRLAPTPLGPPVDVGQVLRAMRLRQGTTQAEVARRLGITQSAFARWESGETALAPESLHGALYALGATPEEALALMAVEARTEAEDLGDVRDRLGRATTAPLALRDVLLLGLESELWWRATWDPSAESLLCHTLGSRAHQAVMRGAVDEIEGHVGRTLRLVRSTGKAQDGEAAVFAGAWVRQRRGDAAGAARALERWGERMAHPQSRLWLRSSQGFATIRAGDAAQGLGILEDLLDGARAAGGDVDFFQIDLVEACLLADLPERAADALAAMGPGHGTLSTPKTLLALGKEPSEGQMEAARAFGKTSWGAGREVEQIERGLAQVRRGKRARFVS